MPAWRDGLVPGKMYRRDQLALLGPCYVGNRYMLEIRRMELLICKNGAGGLLERQHDLDSFQLLESQVRYCFINVFSNGAHFCALE